jgi:hypothetical protein
MLMLIYHPLICVITYLVHRSCIPYLVLFVDPTMLLVRSLSCFFGPCIDQDWDSCELTSHVPLWCLQSYNPRMQTLCEINWRLCKNLVEGN